MYIIIRTIDTMLHLDLPPFSEVSNIAMLCRICNMAQSGSETDDYLRYVKRPGLSAHNLIYLVSMQSCTLSKSRVKHKNKLPEVVNGKYT